MRTPILIRDGSLVVETGHRLDGPSRSPDGRWLYIAKTLGVARASVDAVTSDGAGFVVRGDRQHRRPAEREVRLWIGSDTAGVPPLVLTVANGKLTLSSDERLREFEGTNRSHAYRYPAQENAVLEYAYQIVAAGEPQPQERGLRHLVLMVNARWQLPSLPDHGWAWLAVGAGLGVAGALLLGKAATTEDRRLTD